MIVEVRQERPVSVPVLISHSSVSEIPGAERTLADCLHKSIEVWQGLVNGEVACVWGLIPPTLLSQTAYLWLLTTDIATRHKFLLVRYSQRYVEAALDVYPELCGDVIFGNWLAKRWLRWLGAEFGPAQDGRWPFVIKRKD